MSYPTTNTEIEGYINITNGMSLPAQVILSSQKHLDKSRDYTFLHPWLGTGLLTSTGG